jgi:hypothetical protein
MLRASALSALRPLSGVHALAESRPLLTASNCSERSEAYIDGGSGWVDRGEKARLRPSPIPFIKVVFFTIRRWTLVSFWDVHVNHFRLVIIYGDYNHNRL